MGWVRKLTNDQAADIRCRYAAGLDSQRALARAFGVHHNTIQQIVAGDSYRGAGGPLTPPMTRPRRSPRRKLSRAQAAAARRRVAQGESYRAVADDLGMSWSAVWKLANGLTYREER
jgi:DNA invertase Pin-like site-specific DNA recombinase